MPRFVAILLVLTLCALAGCDRKQNTPNTENKSHTEPMSQRLSYDESCRALQREKLIDQGDIPPFPKRPPRYDDEVLGASFFRTMLADAKLEHLTLPRTFFGRSEIRAASFQNTDLSESTANWNDFEDVNFSSADLSRCDLRGCVLRRVRFIGARLAGADFRHCSFTDCDFTGADLAGAKFTRKAGARLHLSSEQQGVIDWQADDGKEPEGG
jgi:uncharacterized protein YjbI with pentapeptide repeats